MKNLCKNRFILVTGLMLVDSMHFVFARILLPHIAPSVAAMLVLGIGTVEIFFIIILKTPRKFSLSGKQLPMYLSIGFLVGASTYIDYEAVAYIDPGTAALLFQFSIFFGLALGIIWMRDRLTTIQVIGSVLAIAGVVVITFQPGDYLRIGSLLVLCSALMYSLHAAIAKRYGSGIDFMNFFFFRLLSTTIFLFLFSFAHQELIWPDGATWLLLVMVGSVDVVISRALYYMALRQLKVSIFSISFALSPVAAMLWTVLFFNTYFTLKQILGAILVLTGALFAMTQKPSKAHKKVKVVKPQKATSGF